MEEKFNLDTIDKTFAKFKVGQEVEATIVDEMKDGLLLNIGGKKDGFIYFSDEENDSLNDVKVGDVVNAIITNLKDENGRIVLSKQKADDIKKGNLFIKNLQIGNVVKLIITGTNKAGLLSKVGNYEVFIPFSQISNKKVDNNLQNYVNKQFNAIILELDIEKNKIIASIKAYDENERITKENAFWESIFEEKIVEGQVVRFTDFGAFVSIDGFDCLVHNSEASYDRNKKASEVLELNQKYSFKVIKVDKENKKVSLSYKALQNNPLTEKLKMLNVGDVVKAEVKKILNFGAIVKFGDDIEGLLHIKELSHFYIKNVYEVAKVGQVLDLKIINIDLENNRVSLSLKAMQEEPNIVKFSNDVNNN